MSGEPAVFLSSAHAWIGLRLAYLADVIGLPEAEVAAKERSYRSAMSDYRAHLEVMGTIVGHLPHDIEAAARLWGEIDQPGANEAFNLVLCEREWLDGTTKPLIATLAERAFGLQPPESIPVVDRCRRLRKSDNQAAWEAASSRCMSCGLLTISQRQHDLLRRTIRDNPALFDTEPTYKQSNGNLAPLWSSRTLIASKGVADHIKPWSLGGPTDPTNLANVCAACNYSRNGTPLETLRVATFSTSW